MTWEPVADLVVLAALLDAAGVDEAPADFFAEVFFVDDFLAEADDAGVEDAPDTADDAGSVVKLVLLGVVWNTRTPTRPAIVPPSTMGVRFTASCLSGWPLCDPSWT